MFSLSSLLSYFHQPFGRLGDIFGVLFHSYTLTYDNTPQVSTHTSYYSCTLKLGCPSCLPRSVFPGCEVSARNQTTVFYLRQSMYGCHCILSRSVDRRKLIMFKVVRSSRMMVEGLFWKYQASTYANPSQLLFG